MVNRAVLLPGQLPVFGSDSSLVDLKCWLPINELAGSRLNNMIDSLNPGVMTGGSWAGNGVSLDGTADIITLNRIRYLVDWTVLITYTPDSVSGRYPILDQGDILIYQSDDDIIFGITDSLYIDYTATISTCLTAGRPVDIAVTRSGTTVTAYVRDNAGGSWSGTFTASGTALLALTNLIIGSDSRTAFVYPALTATDLTSEKGLLINASDVLEYGTGSDSLTSAVNVENWNGTQLTIRVWIESLNFVPGDGLTHYILDNQGSGATQNRVELYIDTAGLLIFDLHDNDSTQHRVQYDITGWSAGERHHIVARYDLNADEIELYTDGASRDATPDNALSSDTIGTIGSLTHYGKDNADANQINGVGTLQVFNRSWSDAEVTADWNSSNGSPFVCGPDTLLLGVFE